MAAASVKIPAEAERETLDEPKHKEFRKLLGVLGSRRELDKFAERERAIERNRHLYRFRELKRTVILPTLKEFMVDLEKQGHLTHLLEKSPEKIRFDVQVQSKVARRCAIEFTLQGSEPGSFRVIYVWGWSDPDQEVYPLERLEAAFVAERVLQLLKGLV